MQRLKMLSTVALILSALVVSGCGEDPKARIALLEEQNQSLAAELQRVRGDADGFRRARDNCQNELLAARQDNKSLRDELANAPEVVELPGQWQAVEGGAMVAVEGSVLFRPGQVTLREESKTLLDRLASEINSSFPNKDIYVFGHTDTDPIRKSGWKDNRELSAERALAVVRYLQTQGVPAIRLVACGWGEYKPVATNTTDDGKKRNRRVELFAADSTLVATR